MYVAITTEANEGRLVLYGPFTSLHGLRWFMNRRNPGVTYIVSQLLDSGDCMDAV